MASIEALEQIDFGVIWQGRVPKFRKLEVLLCGLL